jgi:hypothetical protein
MLDDNGLTNRISPEALMKFKKSDYQKIWVDPKTYNVIAYTILPNKRVINFNIEYINFLTNMKSISTKPKLVIKTFDMDSILDKISIKGIDALSKDELSFLNEQSKK